VTIDLSNPQGFSKFWDDVVTAFREVAIDNPMQAGGNLYDSDDGQPVFNDHIKGPVDGQTLASQYAYPVVWSVPQNWSPAYDTTASDEGTLSLQVVVFTQDADQEVGFRKARELLGRITNNVENDRSLSGGSTDAAGKVGGTWLMDFNLNFTLGQQKGQLTYAQGLFDIEAKRLL